MKNTNEMRVVRSQKWEHQKRDVDVRCVQGSRCDCACRRYQVRKAILEREGHLRAQDDQIQPCPNLYL